VYKSQPVYLGWLYRLLGHFVAAELADHDRAG